jgi:broad specificity phosphatase PhoE
VLLAWVFAPCFAADSVWYVVRHAEKATTPADDPPLTAIGTARAASLVHTLAEAPLATVWSTDTTRTRTTAAPVAAAHHLAVQTYDDPAALLAAGRTAGGAHLVVGHSNTIGKVVEQLGGAPGAPVGDLEFDRLYVVVVPDQGAATTLVLRYGP